MNWKLWRLFLKSERNKISILITAIVMHEFTYNGYPLDAFMISIVSTLLTAGNSDYLTYVAFMKSRHLLYLFY